MPKLLIADDDASIRTVLSRVLEKHGHEVRATGDGRELLNLVDREGADAVIADVVMPCGTAGENGIDVLKHLRAWKPELPVIIISAQSTLKMAMDAANAGAYEYIAKPFDLDHIVQVVEKATRGAAAAVPEMPEAEMVIGTSPAMQEVYRAIARVTGVDLTVLIHGESGTGKEVIARALHDASPRRHKPFMAVNLAAIPRELVESELFGHEKGAFTGAVSRKSGVFEQASGGTVFLDEIGDMPLEAQTRLLRVLQQQEFTPVGSTRVMKVNARVICATHRDLEARVKAGEFREDLYFRLNVIPLTLPPLKARCEDIPALATHFLQKAEARGLPRKILAREALVALQEHSWPGNVRELENLVYRLCALTPEQVVDTVAVKAMLPGSTALMMPGAANLQQMIGEHLRKYFEAHGDKLPPSGLYERVLALAEKPLLEQALAFTNGNQIKTASMLGINRNTLRKMMRERGVKAKEHA